MILNADAESCTCSVVSFDLCASFFCYFFEKRKLREESFACAITAHLFHVPGLMHKRKMLATRESSSYVSTLSFR